MNDAIDGADSHEDPQADAADVEAKARVLGWIPEDEFKAKKPDRRAKSAAEFLEDTDRLAERLSPRVQKMLNERVDRLDRAFQAVTQLQTRQYQEDLETIKAAQKAALKDGDEEEYDRLEVDKTKLIKQGPDSAPAKDPNQAFKERNDWYMTDDTLTDLAVGASHSVIDAYKLRTGKDMPLDEMLEAVEKKVKASAEYREKYGKKTNGHASVDGGSENGGEPPTRKKGFAQLPPEAKKAYGGFDERIKKTLTPEKYAEQYWSDV